MVYWVQIPLGPPTPNPGHFFWLFAFSEDFVDAIVADILKACFYKLTDFFDNPLSCPNNCKAISRQRNLG
jgi:hypothetical protein